VGVADVVAVTGSVGQDVLGGKSGCETGAFFVRSVEDERVMVWGSVRRRRQLV